jgi:hypothetical protein
LLSWKWNSSNGDLRSTCKHLSPMQVKWHHNAQTLWAFESTVLPHYYLRHLLHTVKTLRLLFCSNLKITHIFNELVHISRLVCSNNSINNIFVYLMTSQHQGVVPLFEIIFPYIQTVSSVLKIPSAGGKYKASVTVGHTTCFIALWDSLECTSVL